MKIIKKKPYYDKCIYCEGWKKYFSTKIEGDTMTSMDCIGELNKNFCYPEIYNWFKKFKNGEENK